MGKRMDISTWEDMVGSAVLTLLVVLSIVLFGASQAQAAEPIFGSALKSNWYNMKSEPIYMSEEHDFHVLSRKYQTEEGCYRIFITPKSDLRAGTGIAVHYIGPSCSARRK